MIYLRENKLIMQYSIKEINTHCLKQFTAHWECLENNNHHMWECRKPEMQLNNCVFDKLVRLFIPFFLFLLYVPVSGVQGTGCRVQVLTLPRVSRKLFPVLRRMRSRYTFDLSSRLLNTRVLSTRNSNIVLFVCLSYCLYIVSIECWVFYL